MAVNYVVNVATDASPTTGGAGSGTTGDLRYALTRLSSTSGLNQGTSGSAVGNNNIFINLPTGTTIRTGAADLPVIARGVTICNSSSSSSCVNPGYNIGIHGATSGAPTTPAARLFATYGASVALNNLDLQYGRAQGGTGGTTSGGGGMGAGGGAYVDYGQVITLNNTTIINSIAKGGAGGDATSGLGGGGASFTRGETLGVTNKNASGSTGGGDFPNSGASGGAIAYAPTLSGYGGGNGGGGGAGVATTGTNAGTNGADSSGGNGGYCGGGGGRSNTGTPVRGNGGGGGNKGGDGGNGAGGGGGSYGSGGGGGVYGGGGGGGGFGGGGGGPPSINDGGGGGGFGGGGR